MAENETLDNNSLAKHAVVALAIAGISLAFMVMGYGPRWEAYLVSALLALGFLIASLFRWPSSEWLGLLSLCVLLLSMFWDPDKPLSAATGLALTILSALTAQGKGVFAPPIPAGANKVEAEPGNIG